MRVCARAGVCVWVCACGCVGVYVCVRACVCLLGLEGGGVQTVGGYVGEVRGWYHYYTVTELSLLATDAILVCQTESVCPLRTDLSLVKNREGFKRCGL